jgi:hypothetical protein
LILVDLNILLYAVNAGCPEYGQASSWLRTALEKGEEPIGLTWAAILGFLRLSTSPRLFPRPLKIEEASRFMETLFAHPRVRKVLPGEGHWALLRHLLSLSGTGGNLVNDAHLAASALEYDAKVATRDADFSRFPGIRTLSPF